MGRTYRFWKKNALPLKRTSRTPQRVLNVKRDLTIRPKLQTADRSNGNITTGIPNI